MSWAEERARIVARYDARLDVSGPGREALAVGPADRHELRFAILCEVGITSGDHVLDVGCGLGDFRAFLQSRGLDVTYTGVDINPRLLEHARLRHPDATFLELDAVAESLPQADWVVSSTSFNLRLAAADNQEVVRHVLAQSFASARKGVAFDFLSAFADFQHPDAYHYDPMQLFAYAKTLTKRVTLRHDYPLFEFMLYLYPDFTGWGART